MHIHHDAGTLHIVLPEECLIFEVEAHARLVAEIHWDAGSINRVVVDLGAVRSMDTAYLQLVLCIARTARDRAIACSLDNAGPAVHELRDLYGRGLFPHSGSSPSTLLPPHPGI